MRPKMTISAIRRDSFLIWRLVLPPVIGVPFLCVITICCVSVIDVCFLSAVGDPLLYSSSSFSSKLRVSASMSPKSSKSISSESLLGLTDACRLALLRLALINVQLLN